MQVMDLSAVDESVGTGQWDIGCRGVKNSIRTSKCICFVLYIYILISSVHYAILDSLFALVESCILYAADQLVLMVCSLCCIFSFVLSVKNDVLHLVLMLQNSLR